MSFEEFCKAEHEKRVAHYVDYIQSHEHAPNIEDCKWIFGVGEVDARPIYNDAVAQVVTH